MGESVIVRGRNRADSLARRERVRRSRLSPTKRKCRLGEAGLNCVFQTI